MSKTKIPNSRKAYGALQKRVERYVASLNQVYSVYNGEVSKMVAQTSYNAAKPFLFSDYPETRAVISRVLAEFANHINAIVINGITAEWGAANLFNDKLASMVLKRYGANHKDGKYKRYYNNNASALKAFIQRKDSNGFTISDKIWNMAKDYKSGLETAISSGMETGMSAVTLSKRISKYLHDFPKLRKDYTERFGTATQINDCEYRSARLARTEINMAYRAAEHERWQQMDFVVGYEIKRSGRGYNCPMCEALAGKYPKEFKFISWHPNCMCYMISILKTEEEFWEWDGRSGATTESVNEIKYMPANFTGWIKQNEGRIIEAKSVPYFIRDNSQIVPELYIASSKRYAEYVDYRVEAICKELSVFSTPINIKSDARIKEKANKDYGGKVADVMDIVRTTIVADESKFDALFSSINNRFDVIRYKTQDFSQTTGYVGHLFNIKTSGGTFAEIQVNTPQMIYAKEAKAEKILGRDLFEAIEKEVSVPHGLGHKYYEQIRRLSRPNDDEKIEKLNRISREYYENIKRIRLY